MRMFSIYVNISRRSDGFSFKGKMGERRCVCLQIVYDEIIINLSS
jgi:hypothetical protein